MDGERTRIENTSSSCVLTISGVLPVDVGSYTIFVRNRHCTSQHTTILGILGVRSSITIIFRLLVPQHSHIKSLWLAIQYNQTSLCRFSVRFFRSTRAASFLSVCVSADSGFCSPLLVWTYLRWWFTGDRLCGRNAESGDV